MRRHAPSTVALGVALVLGLVGASMEAGRVGSRIVEAPLHRAIVRGDLAAVRRLLDAGTPPDLRTYGGMTGLGLAVVMDRWPVANLLLSRGADRDAQVYGLSLAHRMALSGDWDGYDWLMAYGAKRDPGAVELARHRPAHPAGYDAFTVDPALVRRRSGTPLPSWGEGQG